MNRKNIDIDDNEIRIISPKGRGGSRLRLRRLFYAVACAAVVLVAVAYALFWSGDDATGSNELTVTQAAAAPVAKKGYVEIADTVAGDVALIVLIPREATPQLHIGADVLQQSDVVMAMPAADLRADNGEVVGACVIEGRLVSRGQAKSGFCAIIGGKVTIGAADATPFFEKAIETDGYFFRQYPLVVGNQLVENKPKGRSLRKALAEWHGRTVVVLSRSRLTFHDFAQALVDLGVSNAIYLVGSEASGFAVDASGRRMEWSEAKPFLRTHYIIWR